MHVIICGGRDYHMTPDDLRWLARLRIAHQITKVLHGDASGVDTSAKVWAHLEGLTIEAFPAHWQAEGSSAGPRRNARMLSYLLTSTSAGPHGTPPAVPRAVIAFPGGRGTADMCRRAHAAGVQVFTQQSYDDEEPEA